MNGDGLKPAITAISVYLTESQYNMVRVDEDTTCEKICKLVVRKRNLDASLKFHLVVETEDDADHKLRPEEKMLETLAPFRILNQKFRVVLKSESQLEDDSESEDEDIFGGMEPSSEHSAYQGYLMKRGGGRMNKSWKQRFFELQRGELIYKKKPTGRKRGTIPLMEAVVNPAPGEKASSGRFYISVPDNVRVFHLEAQSRDMMEVWVEKIRKFSQVYRENQAMVVVGTWMDELEVAAFDAQEKELEKFVSVEGMLTTAVEAEREEGEVKTEARSDEGTDLSVDARKICESFERFLRENEASTEERLLKFCKAAVHFRLEPDERKNIEFGKNALSEYFAAVSSQRRGRPGRPRSPTIPPIPDFEEGNMVCDDLRLPESLLILAAPSKSPLPDTSFRLVSPAARVSDIVQVNGSPPFFRWGSSANLLTRKSREEARSVANAFETAEHHASEGVKRLAFDSLLTQVYEILEPLYASFARQDSMIRTLSLNTTEPLAESILTHLAINKEAIEMEQKRRFRKLNLSPKGFSTSPQRSRSDRNRAGSYTAGSVPGKMTENTGNSVPVLGGSGISATIPSGSNELFDDGLSPRGFRDMRKGGTLFPPISEANEFEEADASHSPGQSGTKTSAGLSSEETSIEGGRQGMKNSLHDISSNSSTVFASSRNGSKRGKRGPAQIARGQSSTSGTNTEGKNATDNGVVIPGSEAKLAVSVADSAAMHTGGRVGGGRESAIGKGSSGGTRKKWKEASLFDDVDEDEDLFGGTTSGTFGIKETQTSIIETSRESKTSTTTSQAKIAEKDDLGADLGEFLEADDV